MNITQRKLLNGYNRATASDHRRDADDEQRAENMALAGLIAFVILGAVLKVAGLL